ncbi:MAG: T9SS type A sorting domain-containing protein [candidate division WOR-3 bacterium]
MKTVARLKIYDASGKLTREFLISSGDKEYSLNWSDASSGIYFYRLTTKNYEFKGKLIKN